MGFIRSFRRQMSRQMKQKEIAAKKRSRKMLLEPLEPRFLLSADISTTGVAAVMDSGIDQLESDLNSFFNSESVLNTLVPLIVQGQQVEGPDGTDVISVAPSIRDLLAVDVDLDHDGVIDAGLEATLDVYDSDNDGSVELVDEILKPLLFDEIATILGGSPATNGAFISALNALDEIHIGGDGGFSLTLDSFFDTSNANQVSFEFDLSILFSQEMAFDLGTEADNQSVNINGSYTLPVRTEIAINDLTFGAFTSGENAFFSWRHSRLYQG